MLATKLEAMKQKMMDAALVCLIMLIDVGTLGLLMAFVLVGDHINQAVRLGWLFFVFWGILYTMLIARSHGFYFGLSSLPLPSVAFSVNALILGRLLTMPITPWFFWLSNSRMLVRICASMINPPRPQLPAGAPPPEVAKGHLHHQPLQSCSLRLELKGFGPFAQKSWRGAWSSPQAACCGD
ncbi:unnamed protein product [Polarella glacialis]|uniref:Uncharacterized protein n=1 Tax=Polarella glacialis TaxID=89957 RepID=A0A813DRT7_POLGL|nr:unnamed protein product [Polarella glacialis]